MGRNLNPDAARHQHRQQRHEGQQPELEMDEAPYAGDRIAVRPDAG